MPTEVATLCFHTRDAIRRDGGSFTFAMPSGRLRTDAAKVSLSSCEFPMVQWTVEEGWNRLWVHEGLRLTDRDNALHVAWAPGERPAELRLPPRLNAAVVRVGEAGSMVVECGSPHGLFSESGRVHSFAARTVLVAGSSLDVPLVPQHLTRVSATAFRLSAHHPGVATLASDARPEDWMVVAPIVGSPVELCAWLSEVASRGPLGERVLASFAYDGPTDRVRLTLGIADAEPTRTVRLVSTPLARRLGLSTASLELRGASTTEVPSEATALWGFAELPPGFYAPCHRPMCVGQPLRLGPELEAAANAFYFPLLGASSNPSSHMLVFSDPDGRIHTCTVPPGRYTVERLCTHLERTMTAAARSIDAGVAFSVSIDASGRFVFECERQVHGRSAPAPFSLLFHHPLCLDAARLGFAPQPLVGNHVYVAPTPTRKAASAEGRATNNLLRVSEIPSQKRLRFHAVAPPSMVCVVLDGSSPGRLRLRTHVNRQPFAHGLQSGDVVRLSACGACKLSDGEGGEASVPGSTAALEGPCSCIVAASDGDVDELVLRTPRLADLNAAGTCLQVLVDVEPWSLHFGKPHSLPATLVGFDPTAVCWSLHGSVAGLPPYEAPHCHCLDHPDYVCLTFSEGEGAGIEHSFDGESKHIFCKLSLYPLFREERLPRDTSLLRGNMGTFTLGFWNPDLRTPYHFHGAQFSFSLSFVSAVPG